MKLLNEIIDAATDTTQPVSNTLRKCVILAFDLKNDTLKRWVEGELNGFDLEGEIPAYRVVTLNSMGNFQGPFGAWIPQRPLPMAVLKSEHRKYLDPRKLTEPIASYESITHKQGGRSVFNWPSDLIAIYQAEFIPGYALAQAWQEAPTGLFVGIVDQVRTRILRFALEIRGELGEVNDDPALLEPAKVQQAVTNYIFGGQNIIAGTAQNFCQIGSIEVRPGDLGGLAEALKTLGIAQQDVEEAMQAIVEDGRSKDKALGVRALNWIGNMGAKLGNAGAKIGLGAAQALVTQWMLQYLGLKA